MNTDSEPSVRLAISAIVPSGLIRTVVAPAPAVSVCTTFGGCAVRSITDTRSSGAMPNVPDGSALVAPVTMAKLSSGAIATAIGGPTTLPGASTVATMRGSPLRSMTLTVSGGASLAATWFAAASITVWASLDEIAMSARATPASAVAASRPMAM